MNIENVVRNVTVRGQVTGMDQVARSYDQVSSAADGTAVSAGKVAEAQRLVDQALASAQRQLQDSLQLQERYAETLTQQARVMGQVTAANDNYADSHGHVATALRLSVKAAIDYGAATLATAGAVGAGVLLFGGLLAVIGEIIIAYKAVKLEIALVTEAWRLGGERLEEYRQIAEKAASLDLSTGYFQRLTKGAEAAKIPVDAVTESLKTLQKASADTLGGSELQKLLDKHVDAGNFGNNPGVAAFTQANTTEQRYQAIVTLISSAMEQGERLAAIDIANTALGPAVADNLRKDSDYLEKIQAAAAKVADTQLVSDADIGRAVMLKAQYDEAVKILETRWHPIQELLTGLGIQMQTAWVNIVSTIASAVDYVFKLVEKLNQVPAAVWTGLQFAGGVAAKTAGALVPGGGAVALAVSGVSAIGSSDASTNAAAAGYDKLRVAMQNYANVQKVIADNQRTRDTSHTIDDKQALEQTVDAYDRARDAAQKHYAQMVADSEAAGLGAAALAEFQTKAALTTAALIAQRDMTPELIAEIDAYGKAAGTAAEANARMKVAAQISFQQQTMFLSPEDLKIAQQLAPIYGNDVPRALASTEAAQLRVIDNIKQTRDTAQEFAKTFAQGLLQGKSLMDSLVASADQLASKMADKAITDAFSGNYVQAGVEAAVAVGASLFSSDQKAAKQLKEAQDTWAKAGPAFQKFIGDMTTGPQGSIADSLSQAWDRGYDLWQKAIDAKDYQGAKRIEDAYNQYAATLKARFAAVFAVTIQGFEDGLGENSPLLQAAQKVAQELANAQDFLGNTSTTFGAGSAQYAQAAKAQQDYLLSLLQTPKPLSAVQQGLMQIHGTAAALQGALETLGMSSVATAAAINDGVDKAIANLAATFSDSLTQRFNTATGQDYLNSAEALLQQHAQDLADAAALGNSPALLAQVQATFQAEAQKIVEGANLAGDQFASFIDLFPEFSGVVHQASAQLTQSIQSIQQYLDSLSLGNNSILSPQDQLAQAEAIFQRQYQQAQGGDATAMAGITQAASALLDQAKGFYASSSGYTDIYNVVVSALQSLTGGPSATPADTSLFGIPSVPTVPAAGGAAPLLAGSSGGGAASGDGFGKLLQSQTDAFVKAIGAAVQMQVSAIMSASNENVEGLDRVVTAIEANRARAPRPNAR